MRRWLEECESWLTRQYQSVLGLNLMEGSARLRWLAAESLTSKVAKENAHSLVIEDDDIGWLLFLLPYEPSLLQQQVNQALGLRSRLLRESNYTGSQKSAPQEDKDSSWRVGLVWLVANDQWSDWQRHVLELRRESGAAEEMSFDAIQIVNNDVSSELDKRGLPRLLLHTRALLALSANKAETWLSADSQVSAELENFSQQFDTPRARVFAREVEEKRKSFQPTETRDVPSQARELRRFRVKHCRNLDSIEIVADNAEDMRASAIVLYGPNGTGKSSFAEALSLAAFETSPRLEQFLRDKDLQLATEASYFKGYLTPLTPHQSAASPSFAWEKEGKYEDTKFVLSPGEDSNRRFEGVVLNQEDSLDFTRMSRDELAARVLRGYSALADHLWEWLRQEERRVSEAKAVFTRKYGLTSSITRSATAYNRLAQTLLSDQLQRPSPEFLDWLRFLGRFSDDDGRYASKLALDWTTQQANVISRLADTAAKLQERGVSRSLIVKAMGERLNEFDNLANQSGDLRQRLEKRIAILRESLNVALAQIESWGMWLISQATAAVAPEADSQTLRVEMDDLTNKRSELEKTGKALRSRLDLMDQGRQFLISHWAAEHPDVCPLCNSNVTERKGIEAVVTALQAEIDVAIQALRVRHVEIQNRQRELESKQKLAGLSACPLSTEDQVRLKNMLTPFLPVGAVLEGWLVDPGLRERLKGDLQRMRILPEAPKAYADPVLEAERLAGDFIALSQEADKALEDPQAVGAVQKAFEQRLEKVLTNHLPSTLERVWMEIALTLTAASWLLPVRPKLQLEKRGKAVSVQDDDGRHIRYIYNAAERHVLGLAWFFTYYLAKRRFEEAWMLLDDPAQEMDQPSFRELVRLWETLLRLYQRRSRPLTLIVTLHQEERALDAARATNGQLYVLGWQKEQEGLSIQPSVKRVVMLAPGFHPLKPDRMFG